MNSEKINGVLPASWVAAYLQHCDRPDEGLHPGCPWGVDVSCEIAVQYVQSTTCRQCRDDARDGRSGAR